MAANRGKPVPPGTTGAGTAEGPADAQAQYVMEILLTGKPSQVATDFGTIAAAADGTTTGRFITWRKA